MFIERTITQAIDIASKSFKIIMLTGPRQVGKTTVLQHLAPESRVYLTLDDLNLRFMANNDPAVFISKLQLPVLIDEVQYAPQLFSYIKMLVDKEKTPGLFWLTGSQQFEMMKNVTESLAGRVAIFNLYGISLAEEEGRPQTPPFIPSIEAIKSRQNIAKAINIDQIYYKIWRGGYPDLVANSAMSWEKFYESYVTTYIERDVRAYLNIDNLIAFRQFMQICAARTGQMVNYRSISNDCGISEPTIKSWFNILRASGLITIVQPYFNNITKRFIKTPKFHFMDTGLCCFLAGWLSPEVLERGAMAGAMLESYVVSEIIKSYVNNGKSMRMYYYADKEQREVDLLIEENCVLYPIEIKKSGSLANMNFKNFDFLKSLNVTIGHGCVLCFTDRVIPITNHIDAVPVGYI